MKLAMQMAFRIGIAAAQIHIAPTALAIERAHGKPERMAICVCPDRKRSAHFPAVKMKRVAPRAPQLREVGNPDPVAGCSICVFPAQLTAKYLRAVSSHDCERISAGLYGCELLPVRQIP